MSPVGEKVKGAFRGHTHAACHVVDRVRDADRAMFEQIPIPWRHVKITTRSTLVAGLISSKYSDRR